MTKHKWEEQESGETGVLSMECIRCNAFVVTGDKHIFEYLKANPPSYECASFDTVPTKCKVCNALRCHCKNFGPFGIAVFKRGWLPYVIIFRVGKRRFSLNRK